MNAENPEISQPWHTFSCHFVTTFYDLSPLYFSFMVDFYHLAATVQTVTSALKMSGEFLGNVYIRQQCVLSQCNEIQDLGLP